MLVATKLDTPRLGSNHVHRPRLLEQLSSTKTNRLTVISTPAGFGKTSLVAEWLEHNNRTCAWLSLDKTDSDLAIFLAYFIAAIQMADTVTCHNIQEILRSPVLPDLQKIVVALLNDLAELSRDVTVVLDDYHLILNRSVHELLTLLVYRATNRLHLIIATRSDPPFPLAKWRAKGYIVEIHASNLRFTLDEARAFLVKEIGMAVPEPIFRKISEFTEGWITGLKLAALSIRDRISSVGDAPQPLLEDTFANLSNRHISDFLLEDVLSYQPKQIRDFLIRISIVDRFTYSLCDALHRGTSESSSTISTHDILKWVERSNLFLIALDDERHWYRFHNLFRNLLENRLRQKYSETVIVELHHCASIWFAGQGLMEEAIQHALSAGDFQSAADLIELHKHDFLNRKEWGTLQRWLDSLPESLIACRPALLLTQAMILHFLGHDDQLLPILNRVEVLLANIPASAKVSEPGNPNDAFHLAIERLALSSLALSANGTREPALDALDDALELAQHRSVVHTFIDLGIEMSSLLADMVRLNRHALFAQKLIQAFTQTERVAPVKPDRHGGMFERLTKREMEILALMANHHSNKEIAQALFISPLTVKSHSRNLYEKLGVNRRRFAIRRAQELGLLIASPSAQ